MRPGIVAQRHCTDIVEAKMNIDILEQLVRQARGGETIAAKSTDMLKSGLITAAEHRSLRVLKLQPAHAVTVPGNNTAFTIGPLSMWG